jgi:hypothetical protein
MQSNNTTSNVHIKVQCENEFRRFVLVEVTYTALAETISSLLGFPSDANFKLSYLDDEGDWVLFATDDELCYACSITKSPLKIQVQKYNPALPAQTQGLKFTVPTPVTVDEDDDEEEEKPWRGCRGRRGRGAGRRGGVMRGDKTERLDAKIGRFTERHAALTAKLIENDLPEEKARAIEWRLSHLQNKIDTLKLKKQQQLGDASAAPKKEEHQEEQAPVPETVCDVTTSSPDEESDREPAWQTRGCGRRGGRGRRGGHQEFCSEEGGKKRGGPLAFACSTPEGKAAFDKVQACKEAVMAARRDKAEKEVISARIEELKLAKANWKDLKMALWKENRAAGACPRKEAK